MAAVQKIVVRCVFEDDTKINVTIDDINPNPGVSTIDIKNKIKAFNAAKGGELSSKMKSKNGYNWIGIDSAKVVTTNRVYIF